MERKSWMRRLERDAREEMGSFELFIVPIAADAEGVTYEAVFA